MKDEFDNLTLELPFTERPLYVLDRVLRSKGASLREAWRAVNHWEKLALKNSDLEMLIAVHDWKKRESRCLRNTRIMNNQDYYPPWN